MAEDRFAGLRPLQGVMRITAAVCLIGAGGALLTSWAGILDPELERMLGIMAVVLCVWANLMCVLLLLLRKRS
ncbi:MAG: hypothetical protein ACFBRM_10140 [Pikeienuella sp.]